MILLMKSQSSQIHRDINWNGGCQGLGGGGAGEIVFNRNRISVWEDEKVLGMDAGDGRTM